MKNNNKFIGLLPKVGEVLGTIGYSSKNVQMFGMDGSGSDSLDVIDVDGIVNDNQKSYDKKTNIDDYLCYLEYSNIDYNYARNKLLNSKFLPSMACTSVHNGLFYGRNFDFYYNNAASLIIKITSDDGDDYLTGHRYASLSVVDGIDDFNSNFIKLNSHSEKYKIAPFVCVDGINENGLVCSVNVVPSGDKGITTSSIPMVEERDTLSVNMIVRYILDNFTTAEEAAKYIRDYISVSNFKTDIFNFEYHYMICDAKDTYILEFIDNKNVLHKVNERPWMTNFYVTDTNFDSNNKVSYNGSNLSPHSQGVERSNLIAEKYATSNTFDGMKNLMTNDLRYTKSYEVEKDEWDWYSEFCGDYTKDGYFDYNMDAIVNKTTDCKNLVKYFAEAYHKRGERKQDHKTWETSHTSIYEIDEIALHFFIKENFDKKYTFKINDTPVNAIKIKPFEVGNEKQFFFRNRTSNTERHLPNIQYSYNGTDWVTLSWGTPSGDITKSEIISYGTLEHPFVYIRGYNPNGFSISADDESWYSRTFINNISDSKVSGNINYLINYEKEIKSTPGNFKMLLGGEFYGDTKNNRYEITLPSEIIEPYAYAQMFYDVYHYDKPCSFSKIILPAKKLTTECYKRFAQKTNINELVVLATDISATECIKNILAEVTTNGTLYVPKGMKIAWESSGQVPLTWTVVEI